MAMNSEWLNQEVTTVLKAGLLKPLYTAAQFVAQEPGSEPVSISMGKTKREDFTHRAIIGCKPEKVTDKTFFDVASLTKVLSTTAIVMCAVDEGLLKIDQKIVSLVDDPFPSWLMSCTIGDLLTHTTPLAPWYDFHGRYAVMQTYDFTMRRLMTQLARVEPRQNTDCAVYSDLGFIVLGRIIENVYGKTIDEVFFEKVTKPLGLNEWMMYRPLHHVNQSHIAATKFLYGVQLQGHADDDNVRAMLHMGGHAGVFATARAIADFVSSLFDGRFPARREVIDMFLTHRRPNSTFALGWDRPTSVDSLSSRLPGDPVVGHLGYTGCSVWVDLQTKRHATLLLNRSCINNEPSSISHLRRAVYKAVWDA